MAGIQEYLEQIKTAVYGRDVRQAIHDGIEQCYKDGKAGAVDLVARQRIDEFTHLEDGSTTGDAELADIRVDANGASYNTAGDAVREQSKGARNSMAHRELNTLDFLKKQSKTTNGITFSWNDDGTCTITGTATSNASLNIFYETNAFPPFIGAGTPVEIRIESDNSESTVGLQIYKCINGSLGALWASVTPSYQGDGTHQTLVPSNLSGMLIRFWIASGKTVNETVRASLIPQLSMDNAPNASYFSDDANTLTRNGIYFVSATGDTPVIANVPPYSQWLEVQCIGDKSSLGVLQISYPWASDVQDRTVMWRTCKSGVWQEWKSLGSGEDGGGTVIQNTYNITTSPHITTDVNGWLQAVDTDTASESGKTDMTGAIMSMLTDTGYCKLSKGIFYVSGSIDMPEGSTLEGCGEDTIIRLLSSIESGYCVKVTKFNTVKGIRFSGGYSAFEPSSSTIGTRNGINYTANADGTGSSMPSIEQCVIDNCWFENFNGSAIYCHNTGGSVGKPLMVSNCFIQRCTAGVNIAYYSEYQKYTNVVITRCYYACINNGGNNVFTACTFHGTIGFSMDGSRNSAHGSVIGCTFNHIDNWNRPSTLGGGTAILVKNASNGYIFTGCQIWYGAIDIRGSRGIAFSDCLIGGNSPEISVTGNLPAFFANCIFHQTPTLDVNESTRFDNCYLDEDGSAISA